MSLFSTVRFIDLHILSALCSKYYDNSNKLVVGQMKDETTGVAIEEFVGLKPKMYSYLVDDNNEHKKVQKVWIEVLLQQ